jgi:ankyrin repeat protein
VNNLPIFELLLQHQADVTLKNRDRETALMIAASIEKVDFVLMIHHLLSLKNQAQLKSQRYLLPKELTWKVTQFRPPYP